MLISLLPTYATASEEFLLLLTLIRELMNYLLSIFIYIIVATWRGLKDE